MTNTARTAARNLRTGDTALISGRPVRLAQVTGTDRITLVWPGPGGQAMATTVAATQQVHQVL